MTSLQAADAIEKGLGAALGRISVDKVPIADGGDGTLDAIEAAVDSERVSKQVEDPLGRRRKADYLLVDGGGTAVVELARASGLALLKQEERNPLLTSTVGTGRLINDALDKGVKKVIVGIGGSATTDGGAGIAYSLGYRFLDAAGNQFKPFGKDLERIDRIDCEKVHPRLREVKFEVASDVDNPLLGVDGAAPVYSPQKGAGKSDVRKLEKGLARLADIVERDLGAHMRDFPGAGAAGGAGYGLMVFLGASLKPGIDLLIEITKLESKLKKADMLVTGEGRMDLQSAQGKAPFGVLKLAKKNKVPAIAFCGMVEQEKALLSAGFRAVLPIVDSPMELEEAISRGEELLERAAFRAGLLLKAGKQT